MYASSFVQCEYEEHIYVHWSFFLPLYLAFDKSIDTAQIL